MLLNACVSFCKYDMRKVSYYCLRVDLARMCVCVCVKQCLTTALLAFAREPCCAQRCNVCMYVCVYVVNFAFIIVLLGRQRGGRKVPDASAVSEEDVKCPTLRPSARRTYSARRCVSCVCIRSVTMTVRLTCPFTGRTYCAERCEVAVCLAAINGRGGVLQSLARVILSNKGYLRRSEPKHMYACVHVCVRMHECMYARVILEQRLPEA